MRSNRPHCDPDRSRGGQFPGTPAAGRLIAGLPVIDAGGNLAGMVTEGDVLRRAETATECRRPGRLERLAAPGKIADDDVRSHGPTIEQVMAPDPVTGTDQSRWTTSPV